MFEVGNLGHSARDIIHLDNAPMDAIHDELQMLIEKMSDACDYASVATQLEQLIAHTRLHFETEEQWMVQSAFPLLSEHRSEHQQLMGELLMMRRRLRPATLALVRSFVSTRLPDWLHQHLQRMDSLLAAHLGKSR